MRVVLTARETIAEWLYPGTWPDLTTDLGDALSSGVVSPPDLAALWRVLVPAVGDGNEVLLPEGFEDVGIPHGGPGFVERLHPDLVRALAALPVHERWRVARDWATALSGRRPNEERLGTFKKLVNGLCDLASRVEGDLMLVVLPERGRG